MEKIRQTLPPILDVCCSARSFYADKADRRVLFADIRREEQQLCDGRTLRIEPDLQLDFRALPFGNAAFAAVIFDPPHLLRVGEKSFLTQRYGRLSRETWQEDLRQGFAECFRVLRPGGCLIFKWSEKDVRIKDVLALTPQKPVIGHFGRIKYPFHWVLFLKNKNKTTATRESNRKAYCWAAAGWGRKIQQSLSPQEIGALAARVQLSRSSLFAKFAATRPWKKTELKTVCEFIGADYAAVKRG